MPISPKKIPEEIRRFVSDRYTIRGNTIIAQFDKLDQKVIFHPNLCPTPPEPFKPASKDREHFLLDKHESFSIEKIKLTFDSYTTLHMH